MIFKKQNALYNLRFSKISRLRRAKIIDFLNQNYLYKTNFDLYNNDFTKEKDQSKAKIPKFSPPAVLLSTHILGPPLFQIREKQGGGGTQDLQNPQKFSACGGLETPFLNLLEVPKVLQVKFLRLQKRRRRKF